MRNNRKGLYLAEVVVSLSNLDGCIDRWTCSRSGVASGTWSVCFTPTDDHRHLIATGGVNGDDLGLSYSV